MAQVFDRLGQLAPFSSIGTEERINVLAALKRPLSGYLGGIPLAGYWVERLQHSWANEFEVEHAVACNSATSGLLAACLSCGVGAGDEVWSTCYSMSATAACALVLGARVKFVDIEAETFGIDIAQLSSSAKPKAIIVTNLFGSPARDLIILADYCRKSGIYLIEDNAQSPFAKIEGRYTGTIGDIGVFSLNVHKHIQAGEGGVCVTRNPLLAGNLEDAINHGELRSGLIGLNLRMTEPTAAIACAQLQKAHRIIQHKIELGETLTRAVVGYAKFIQPPNRGKQYTHVYYVWAALCVSPGIAQRFAGELAKLGLPAKHGYTQPLTDTFGSQDEVAKARDINDRIVCVECCAIEPTLRQVIVIEQAVKEAAGVALGTDHDQR